MKKLIKRILREEAKEQQIFYKPSDKSWEYTLLNGVWHTRAKGSDDKWLSLEGDKYKDTVEELSKLFSDGESWLDKYTEWLDGGYAGPNPVKKNSCNFIIPIAWPTYEPKIEEGSSDAEVWMAKAYAAIKTGNLTSKEGTYGKLGHGGVGLISSDGRVGFFEFGRYEGSGKGMGLTRRVPINIKAQFKTDKKGRCRVINLKEVVKAMKEKSYGEGRKLPLFGHLVPIPNIKGAFNFANNRKQRNYTAIDLEIGDEDFNCGTFIYDVAEAGGLEMGKYCFPDPKSVVDSFQTHSIQKIYA
jgi:hypothetical protein